MIKRALLNLDMSTLQHNAMMKWRVQEYVSGKKSNHANDTNMDEAIFPNKLQNAFEALLSYSCRKYKKTTEDSSNHQHPWSVQFLITFCEQKHFDRDWGFEYHTLIREYLSSVMGWLSERSKL